MAHQTTCQFVAMLRDPVERRRLAETLRPGDECFARRLDVVVRAASVGRPRAVESANAEGRDAANVAALANSIAHEPGSSRSHGLERTPRQPR